MHRERFAPSPTGYLHLGHAFSALTAFDRATACGGELCLRLDDLDKERCRPHFAEAIIEDLNWLGIHWVEPVRYQSDHLGDYQAAIDLLAEAGLCYPCSCTRRDIREAVAAPHAPVGRSVYPGICRSRSMASRTANDAVRLNMAKAITFVGGEIGLRKLTFNEEIAGRAVRFHPVMRNLVECHGDIVIARRDMSAAYHLAVVVDDAAQSITHVTRGKDLKMFVPLHRLLQAILGLPQTIWAHHDLILDSERQRLAKRRGGATLRDFRQGGTTVKMIRELVGLGRKPTHS